LQTFVEQKLNFLLREYFDLAVPFYPHAGVYTRPDTRKFVAVTALLIGRRDFLMRRVSGVKGLVRRSLRGFDMFG
jgi:hypothetical protein